MKDEIKIRIEQVNRGEVPAGYKRTIVGIVPVEWEETELSQIFNFKNGLNKEKEAFGKGTPIVNYVDVWTKRGLYSKDLLGKVELSKKEIENYNVKKGDVFFTRTSETKNEIGFSSVMLDDVVDTVFSGFVLRARPYKNKIVNEYNQYCYSSVQMRYEIIRKSSITTRALTSGTLLGQVQINLPCQKEQQKIAEILSKWDEAVAFQSELIDKIELQRKGLIQKLLCPRKGWKKVLVGELTKEVSLRNKNNDCLNIKSVSNKFGFINQDEQFSKQVASQDLTNYKKVNRRDIAYNPSRINVGSIALYNESETGIVSPMYVVFRCEKILPELLLLILSTDRGKYDIKTYLAGSVRDSLNYSDLENVVISIPDEKTQEKLVKFFNLLDEKIISHKKKLAGLKQQQKAVQQLLLTGIVRAN